MSIVRWDQFADVEAVFHRLAPAALMNRAGSSVERNAGKLDWLPSTDISENDREYVIRAELPAVSKDDVRVTFDAGVLTIAGERRPQIDQSETYHRVETCYGRFERRFTLPAQVNAEIISCASKDGILTVRVPKAACVTADPKEIAIQ